VASRFEMFGQETAKQVQVEVVEAACNQYDIEGDV
jgi:hypothetical protein